MAPAGPDGGAKLSSEGVDPALRYLKERFPACEAYLVHRRGERESVTREKIQPVDGSALPLHPGVKLPRLRTTDSHTLPITHGREVE